MLLALLTVAFTIATIVWPGWPTSWAKYSLKRYAVPYVLEDAYCGAIGGMRDRVPSHRYVQLAGGACVYGFGESPKDLKCIIEIT